MPTEEWTTTNEDDMPDGVEVVVKWPDGYTHVLQPCIESGQYYWWDEGDNQMYHIEDTVWKRGQEDAAK